MFEEPGNPLCPVKSLQLYLGKIPADAKAFYLQPKRCIIQDGQWLNNMPLGVNTLSQMLPRICKKAGTRIYTNHSLRATTIQKLADAGLEAREIMSVSGHR